MRALLPGVRGVIEAFLARRDGDGLVRTPEGWNDSEGTRERPLSGLTHWLLVWTLRLAAELEDGFGEPEPAGAGGASRTSSLAAATRRSGTRRAASTPTSPVGPSAASWCSASRC